MTIAEIQSATPKSYVVAYRAPAALRFTEDGYFKFHGVSTRSGKVELTIGTRYDDYGFESKIPRELWVDARGTAPTLNEAINDFGIAISTFLQMLCVSENAAILELSVHLAYDSTPSLKEREFFQSFLPDERGLPRITRRFAADSSKAFVSGVANLDERDRDRVLRACSQYQQALIHWGPGEELLALAHLYMGVEALTKVVLRRECSAANTNEDGLATKWSIEKKELDSTIRRDKIFQRDEACYREAKNASDGFEHGYLAYGELQLIATNRRDQTARYLRDAIVGLLKCDDESRQKLLEKQPVVGGWKPVRYFRGTLVGEGEDLAAKDQAYPILKWKSSIKRAVPNATGGIDITPDETITPSLAKGISLRPMRYEVWGPQNSLNRKPTKGTIEPVISQAAKSDPWFDRVSSMLDRVNKAVVDYCQNKEFRGSLTDATLLAFVAESRCHFQAVTVLLKKRLANEALLNARIVFQNARRLGFLASTNDKASVVFGWVRESLSSSIDVDHAAKEAGMGFESSIPLDLAAREARIMARAKRIGFELVGFPPNDSELGDVSPQMRYAELLSSRIANGFGALMSYSKDPGENAIGFNDVCEDTDFIAFVAAFACESVLMVCQAASRIFSWPELDCYSQLLDVIRSQSCNRDAGMSVDQG